MSANALYKPLLVTEFRVVHLLPGKLSDEIHCVLETRSSEVNNGGYEALSYQWGDDSTTLPIRMARLNLETSAHCTTEISSRGVLILYRIHRQDILNFFDQ